MGFLQGRMNRATYWLSIAVAILALVGLVLLTHRRESVGEVVLVLVAVPRLHDIGRSGWWVLAGFGVEIVGVVVALVALPLEQADAVLGVVTLVILGLVIWLGAIPGGKGPNRFGEPPGRGLSFKSALR